MKRFKSNAGRKRRSKQASINFERLEQRQLLAADLGPAFDLGPADGQQPPQELRQRARSVSGQQGPQTASQHRHGGERGTDAAVPESEIRSIDGTGNNLENPDAGSAHSTLLRTSTAQYGDGISTPAGEDRPSAREISNVLAAQETTDTNDRGLTDLTWLFGQFIDHDIDLTEPGADAESFDIEVPTGDPFFDPLGTGEATISLTRSNTDASTGTSTDNPLQQVNDITAFLDGSVIYGSDAERAAALRTGSGGRLNVSEGNLLPFNEAGFSNAGGTSDSLFLAGDIRANENIALTAMHTVWVREHNQWADRIAEENPDFTDEQIYQKAKQIVTAELQAVTYNEFLPALLGENAISQYTGYDSSVDPGINNAFSGAAYRFGHSMLSTELLRLNNDGSVADEGNISLQNAFFSTSELTDNGIDSILKGASVQVANEIDNQVVDDIRNFLFGPPGAGGFDLASLNIQRGRDHGLADYNQTREDFGLERVTSFDQITSDADVAAKLEQLYGTVDNIDLWVGGLAEDHVDGGSMGELFSTIIVDQFERIRTGDRLWYENTLSRQEQATVNQTSLADIIARNTGIEGLSDNVFFAEGFGDDGGDGEHQDRDRHQDRNDRNRLTGRHFQQPSALEPAGQDRNNQPERLADQASQRGPILADSHQSDLGHDASRRDDRSDRERHSNHQSDSDRQNQQRRDDLNRLDRLFAQDDFTTGRRR